MKSAKGAVYEWVWAELVLDYNKNEEKGFK